MKSVFVALAVLAIAGCARTSVMPVARDAVQISVRAAQVCGSAGAQKVAIQLAAVETLKRGYDSFTIVGADSGRDTRYLGSTPSKSYTTGSATVFGHGNTATAFGSSTTTTRPGQPIFATRYNQDIVVKMYAVDDPSGANAISARDTLGPDWESMLDSDTNTCM